MGLLTAARLTTRDDTRTPAKEEAWASILEGRVRGCGRAPPAARRGARLRSDRAMLRLRQIALAQALARAQARPARGGYTYAPSRQNDGPGFHLRRRRARGFPRLRQARLGALLRRKRLPRHAAASRDAAGTRSGALPWRSGRKQAALVSLTQRARRRLCALAPPWLARRRGARAARRRRTWTAACRAISASCPASGPATRGAGSGIGVSANSAVFSRGGADGCAAAAAPAARGPRAVPRCVATPPGFRHGAAATSGFGLQPYPWLRGFTPPAQPSSRDERCAGYDPLYLGADKEQLKWCAVLAALHEQLMPVCLTLRRRRPCAGMCRLSCSTAAGPCWAWRASCCRTP